MMKLKFILTIIVFVLSNAFYQAFASVNTELSSPSCKPPYNIRVKSKGLDYSVISWKSAANNTAWVIKWKEAETDYNDINISNQIDTTEYTINNLKPNTRYFFKIKSICDTDESNWSNEYNFITNLTNPSDCGMHFALKDRTSNYPGKTYFKIQNIEYPDKLLGKDVFIQNIKLVISHTWTSDLQINLKSPSGKKIVLSNSNGLNDGTGYGDPSDSTCSSTIVFTDDACRSITDNDFPFIGLYRPEEPISNLYDSLSPFGTWELEIIDKLKGNTGFLEYIDIDFAPIICPLPKQVSIIPISDTAVSIDWLADPIMDTIIVNIDNSDEIKLLNSGYDEVSVDNNFSAHEFVFRSKCNQSISSVSCPYTVKMLCTTPMLREDFDRYEDYNSDCGTDCFNSDIWYNLTQKKWLINSGATSTENTGPQNDVYGQGKYAYVESSANNENFDTVAVLQSECLDIETPYLGCSMSFYYYMFGIDEGSLQLDISKNGGQSWNNLFYINGNQGNQWILQDISLGEYAGFSCIFRFTAKTLKNKPYGDIAIDDIIFYNAHIALEEAHLYYPDNDGDGYGKDTTGTFFCISPGTYWVKNNLDCDDDNHFINPDAMEIHCNGIDENCNGMEDDPNMTNPIEYTLEYTIPESCDGSKDGQIVIAVTGGEPPYHFQWSNNSMDSILTGVSAGKYICVIQDSAGCEFYTDTIELDKENSIIIEIANTIAPTCTGAKDGSIIINTSGGIEPYNYLWNTLDTTKDLVNAGPGLYSVTVTDSMGCRSVYNDIELKANTIFDIGIINKKDPGCFEGNNGKISLYVSGGVPPYTYKWNNDDTLSTTENLKSGKYYCTITDKNLCFQVYGPIVLKYPEPITSIILAKDNVTCEGEENGLIEIKTTGGTPPYSFIWSNESGDYLNFNDDIYNLKAGIYNLSIVDSKGCHKNLDSIEIETIDSFKLITDSINHVKCSGSNDGYIQVSGTDGYGNYYYYWNNGESLTDNIDSLFAGTYSVTATDDLGCKAILDNIEVQNLNIPVDVNISLLDSLWCYGDSSASLIATVNSQHSPYDYNWSAGSKRIKIHSQDTLTGLGAGFFNVTVTDNKGCIGTSEDIEIIQPSQIQITNVNVDEILCFDDNNGRISLDITGGVPEYNVFWNDSTHIGEEIIKLKAGTYRCTITDQNNCKIESNDIILNQPDDISVTIISNPAHKNYADGSAKLLIQGGVSPYEINWDANANNQTGDKAINLSSGGYDVTITDFNGCVKIIKVYITEIDATNNITDKQIYVYPNPSNNFIYISGINLKMPDFELISISGKSIKIKSEKLNSGIYKIDISDLPAGSYFLKITSAGFTTYKNISIIH